MSSAAMREFDRLTTDRYGIPSLELMENAATATARAVIDSSPNSVNDRAVLVFCGKGNNGGDGAAVARLLAIAGARVDAVLVGKLEDTGGGARVNFERLRDWQEESALRDAPPHTISFFECDTEKGWNQLRESILAESHDVVIDALFGTGLTRPVEGIYQGVVRYINHLREHRDSPPFQSSLVVSIDVPSGLNADSEKLIGEAVRADKTITMTAPKRANVVPPAADYNGKLIIAPIGSPAELVAQKKTSLLVSEAADARSWLVHTRYTPD